MGMIETESNPSFQNIVKVVETVGVSLAVLFAGMKTTAPKSGAGSTGN